MYDDNLIVFPPKADDNSRKSIYSIPVHWENQTRVCNHFKHDAGSLLCNLPMCQLLSPSSPVKARFNQHLF